MYVFDPRHFGTTPYGSKKTGDYRAKFLLQSIQDLKQNLRKIGSDLLIHMGSTEEALKGHCQSCKVGKSVSSNMYSTDLTEVCYWYTQNCTYLKLGAQNCTWTTACTFAVCDARNTLLHSIFTCNTALFMIAGCTHQSLRLICLVHIGYCSSCKLPSSVSLKRS